MKPACPVKPADPTPAGKLKTRVLALEHSPHAVQRLLFRTLKTLASVRRILFNPRLRSEFVTRARYGRRHYQGSTFTQPDRFPVLFEQAGLRLKTLPAPRVLSFGCSTGEEVFTLARYLPHAHITGVDLNPWALKQGRRANSSTNLRFLHSLSREYEEADGFDAIFCMSVFQRTENREGGVEPRGEPGQERARGHFGFPQFELAIAALDRKLKPGGLLFIDQADFDFADTTCAAGYRPLDFPGNTALRQRPLFGPDGRPKEALTIVPRVFVKLSPHQPDGPADRHEDRPGTE